MTSFFPIVCCNTWMRRAFCTLRINYFCSGSSFQWKIPILLQQIVTPILVDVAFLVCRKGIPNPDFPYMLHLGVQVRSLPCGHCYIFLESFLFSFFLKARCLVKWRKKCEFLILRLANCWIFARLCSVWVLWHDSSLQGWICWLIYGGSCGSVTMQNFWKCMPACHRPHCN